MSKEGATIGRFYREGEAGPRLADVAGLRAQLGMLESTLWRDSALATIRTQAGMQIQTPGMVAEGAIGWATQATAGVAAGIYLQVTGDDGNPYVVELLEPV